MPKEKQYIPYRDQYDEKQKKILAIKRKELPGFLDEFFMYLDADVEAAVSTQLAYALDLRIFFEYVKGRLPEYAETELKNIDIKCLEKLSRTDIRYFVRDYLSQYENPEGVVRGNAKSSRARKLAVIKKMYHYYLKSDNPDTFILNDPVSLVTINKNKEKKKPIKYLEFDQVSELLDNIENPEQMKSSNIQKLWNEKTSVRDLAIVTLLLGTGLRVSECIGINLQDINFEDGYINVRRKGNTDDRIYLSEEVSSALKNYVENDREKYKPDENNQNALFLSRKHTRITARSVERLVTKYTEAVTGMTGYSPHKLRSSFATLLLAGDDGRGNSRASLAQVQAALGHSNPATTSHFYAKVRENERRETFENFKLRED